MEEKKYEAIVEAILFTMGESVELERIAKTLELDTERTKKIIEHLMQRYEDDGVGVKIMELDGSYQMCTKGEMYEYLVKIAKQPKKHVLTDVRLKPFRSLPTSSRLQRRKLKRSEVFPAIMR